MYKFCFKKCLPDEIEFYWYVKVTLRVLDKAYVGLN